MTAWPPPYPRIPHLLRTGGATRDDLILSDAERAELLSGLVVVEEKLDGANVMLWLDAAGFVRAATRGGPDAVDRGGQLGPLRAWIGPRSDQLRALLDGGRVLYGEWLWRRHTVRYERLRDWLVGFDVLERSGEWLEPKARDRMLSAAGIERPPLINGPTAWKAGDLVELALTSSLGDDRAEGVIVRRAGRDSGRVRLAKVLAPQFRRLTDAEWAEVREGNRVVP